MIDNKLLNLYRHSLFLFFALKEGILNMPGNKLNPKGYIMDSKKLDRASLNNKYWVLIYIVQKQDKKYQKKVINIIFKIKKIGNFILKHLLISFHFSIAFLIVGSCLTIIILCSVKANCFNIALIITVIIVDKNICGILNNIFNEPLWIYIICIILSL